MLRTVAVSLEVASKKNQCAPSALGRLNVLASQTFAQLNGLAYLFELRPFKLRAINAGYQAAPFSAMGTIFGAWRRHLAAIVSLT